MGCLGKYASITKSHLHIFLQQSSNKSNQGMAFVEYANVISSPSLTSLSYKSATEETNGYVYISSSRILVCDRCDPHSPTNITISFFEEFDCCRHQYDG